VIPRFVLFQNQRVMFEYTSENSLKGLEALREALFELRQPQVQVSLRNESPEVSLGRESPEVSLGRESPEVSLGRESPKVALVRLRFLQAIQPPIQVPFQLLKRHRLATAAHITIVPPCDRDASVGDAQTAGKRPMPE
jgi:hypothetical protein